MFVLSSDNAMSCNDALAVSDKVYAMMGVERGHSLPSYTSIGSYTIVYLTAHDETVCGKCATRYDDDSDPITFASTYDEGDSLYCAVCEGEIESSYGPLENEEG